MGRGGGKTVCGLGRFRLDSVNVDMKLDRGGDDEVQMWVWFVCGAYMHVITFLG